MILARTGWPQDAARDYAAAAALCGAAAACE